MTYSDTVRQARNQQEALVAVAQGIDEILARLADKPADDGWGSWSSGTIAVDTAKKWANAFDVARDEQITELREMIAAETDPDNILAMQAKLRLLTDTGQTPYAATEGRRVEPDEDGIVDLPPVDAARRDARQKWALDFGLGQMMDPPMDNEQAALAYGLGGPLWLYLPQRETIMGLPEHVRRMMVEDVERDSPAQAQELARDILKDFQPNTQDVTIESMSNQMAKA